MVDGTPERKDPGARAQEGLVLAPCALYPLPDGQRLLVRGGTGNTMRVSGLLVPILERCTVLRTLDEHARTVAAEFPLSVHGPNAVRELLLSLKNAGFFISSQDLEAAVTGAAAPSADSASPTVCVVTRDRPALLERAVASALSGQSGMRAREFWVIDDSRDPGNQKRNRTVTEEAAVRHGVPLRYCGLKEQQEVVEALRRASPKHRRAIDFLFGRQDLDTVSHGRAFNFTLLHSFGGALVHVDDDVVCRSYLPPIPGSGSLRWGRHKREVSFFGSQDELESHWVGVGEGPLHPLGTSVGKGVAEVTAKLRLRSGFHLSFLGLSSQEAAGVLAGRGRVAAATCGLYGDPGTASPWWMFDLEGDSRRRFTADRGRYFSALRNRLSWIGVDSPTFSRGLGLLSPLRAMDHRSPLPPYFPLFRGEDYLFGRLMPLVDPDAWSLEFPWAIPHLPDPPRRWPPFLLESPEALSFARMTGILWGKHLTLTSSRDPGHRFEDMGGQIRDMAEADPVAMEEALWGCLHSLRSGFVQILERQLSMADGTPPWYRRDLERLLEVNRDALENPQPPLLPEMSERGADPVSWTMELWREYGRALQAWPGILEAGRH